MRNLLLLLLLGVSIYVVDCGHQYQADIVEDNEFAEFEMDDESEFDDDDDAFKLNDEDFDDDSDVGDAADDSEFNINSDDDDDDVMVETEDDGVEQLDPEEFENEFDEDLDDTIWDTGKKAKKQKAPTELKIANVPLHARSWDKYLMEILMGAGLLVYIINFFIGKAKNNTIASTWLYSHLDFLKTQFELVGDDPQNKAPESTHQLLKESEHTYTFWCSGRVCCEGMLIELKLLKRQDLISIIANYMKPAHDQVIISITMEHMDPFVLCAGNKKSIANLHKTMQDVSLYCNDKMRSGEKYGLSSNFGILSELLGEVPNAILDAKVIRAIKECEGLGQFEYLHISDQFSGAKPTDQDEPLTKTPDVIKTINLCFNIPQNTANIKDMLPLMKMAVYLVDRVRRYKLSKESKMRADKHRQEVELKYIKELHAQRQEAAQQKKEDKARALKDKMMSEEDPEKQRRLDEMIQRREMNKKNKKMMKGRQYKVKSM